MNFRNGKELLSYCEEKNCSISEAMIKREVEDIERHLEETMEKMHTAWDIMKKSVERSLTEDVRSMGGLIGGESKKINQLREDGKNICGSVIS